MDDNNCKELMDQTVMDISTDQSTAIIAIFTNRAQYFNFPGKVV